LKPQFGSALNVLLSFALSTSAWQITMKFVIFWAFKVPEW